MKIIHKVTKDKEGTYYTIDFEVPENVSRFTVGYSYQRGTKGIFGDLFPTNTIDIGISTATADF